MMLDALDALDAAALLVGPDGSILDANRAALDCYGHSLSEMLTLSIHDLRAPGDQSDIDREMRKAVEHGAVYEAVHHRGDGSLFPVEVRSIPILVDGEPALLSLVRDLTARKEEQLELKESESRYRALAESSPLAVFVSRNEADEDRVVLANPACVKLFGASSPEDLIGTSALALFHPDSQALIRERVGEVGETGQPVEAQIARLDGTPVTVEVVVSALPDEGVAAVQVVLRDVTERNAATSQLRQSEEKFATAFHVSPDLLCITRVSDGMILEVNEGYEDLLGYIRAGSIGKTTTELSIWVDVADRARFLATLEETGRVTDFETTLRHKDGTVVPVIMSARTFELQGEACVLSVVADITERKRAEEAIRTNQAELVEAQRIGHFGSFDWDARADTIVWSDEYYRIYGLDPKQPSPGYEEHLKAYSTESAARLDASVKRSMQTGEPYVLDLEHVPPDGGPRWVVARGEVKRGDDGQIIGIRGTAQDITDSKRAERELAQQAERIARTLTSVIDITSNIVELRDPYTAGHQRRVSELAIKIAENLGMSGHEVDDIRVGGLLHDIGKAGIPTEILSKPGALSPIEFTLIKGHAEAGYRLAVSANMAEPIPELIYQHHERCDGSGYPRGLTGDQTLLGAKVLAVADVVEAMMSHRPYRAALRIEAALAEIEQGSGSLYDAGVVKTCVHLFNKDGFEFSEH